MDSFVGLCGDGTLPRLGKLENFVENLTEQRILLQQALEGTRGNVGQRDPWNLGG